MKKTDLSRFWKCRMNMRNMKPVKLIHSYICTCTLHTYVSQRDSHRHRHSVFGIRHTQIANTHQAIYSFIVNWILFHIHFISSVFLQSNSALNALPILSTQGRFDPTMWKKIRKNKPNENPSHKTDGLFLWLTPAS